MTLKLLKSVNADGNIIPAGKIVTIYDPETAREMVRQGIGCPVNPTELWPGSMSGLIAWFLNAKLPMQPFSISSYEHILNPFKYYKALRQDINVGPKGPRARYGALQNDLHRLKAFCDQRNTNLT